MSNLGGTTMITIPPLAFYNRGKSYWIANLADLVVDEVIPPRMRTEELLGSQPAAAWGWR